MIFDTVADPKGTTIVGGQPPAATKWSDGRRTQSAEASQRAQGHSGDSSARMRPICLEIVATGRASSDRSRVKAKQ